MQKKYLNLNPHKDHITFLYAVTILTVLMSLSSCAFFQTKEEKTARELAEEGMEAIQDGRTDAAVKAFKKLKDWYPFSEYAILAELKLGDAHYQAEDYDEAIFAYEEFENLHPKNEAVPYVIYQIGRCHFDRLDAIDRDQTMAEEAVRVFERLIQSHPKSPFAKKAKQHIRVCKKSLAEHDFYVGHFYFKSKHYKAAKHRFQTVLQNYPDLGVHYRAIDYLSQCQDKMDKDKAVSD
jgi:outer membrane protein assembly factor BamD